MNHPDQRDSDVDPQKEEKLGISLGENDPWFHLQQKVGLIPRNGEKNPLLRVLFFVGVAWLPMVLWAWWTKRGLIGSGEESLFEHFGIHVRFLLALPALIIGERRCSQVSQRLLPQFLERSLIVPENADRYGEVIRGIIRMRNSTLPWLVIVVLIVIPSVMPHAGHEVHELEWAKKGREIGFGGWWYLHVARPVFQLFLFGWLWRVVLLTILLRRISKIGLNLVSSHPDRLGGLGFIETFPSMFVPLAFSCSALLAAHWAHEIRWHGEHVKQFQLLGSVFGITMLLVCLLPLLAFLPLLIRAKRESLRAYGTLVTDHGRLVHDRWIERKELADRSLLEAPELGPVVDVNAIYEAVAAMRILPFSKKSILSIVIPIVVPMLAVMSMEVPLGQIFGRILKTLV